MMASRLLLQSSYRRRRSQRPIGLPQRKCHREAYLQDLIPTGMTGTRKDLISKGLVEVRHAHNLDALQVFLVQKLLKIGSEGYSWFRAVAKKAVHVRDPSNSSNNSSVSFSDIQCTHLFFT